MILKIVNLGTSSWYGKARRKPNPLKRGRKSVLTDEEVFESIRNTLKTVNLKERVIEKYERECKSKVSKLIKCE